MVKDWLDFIEFLLMLIRVKFGIVGKVKNLTRRWNLFSVIIFEKYGVTILFLL